MHSLPNLKMWWQLSTIVLSTKEQVHCIDQCMVTVTNWFQLFSGIAIHLIISWILRKM